MTFKLIGTKQTLIETKIGYDLKVGLLHDRISTGLSTDN